MALRACARVRFLVLLPFNLLPAREQERSKPGRLGTPFSLSMLVVGESQFEE